MPRRPLVLLLPALAVLAFGVPSAGATKFNTTYWDVSTFAGTLGLFVALLFLFVRFLPIISIFEMRTMLPEAHVPHGVGAPAAAGAGEKKEGHT